MTVLVCPACDGWRRHPSDRLCGQCGESFIRLSAQVRPQYHYAAPGAAAPKTITVTLRNDGPIGAADSTVVLRDPEIGGVAAEETIRPGMLEDEGDQFPFDIPVLAIAWSGGRWRGVLAHRPPAADASGCSPSSNTACPSRRWPWPMPIWRSRKARRAARGCRCRWCWL